MAALPTTLREYDQLALARGLPEPAFLPDQLERWPVSADPPALVLARLGAYLLVVDLQAARECDPLGVAWFGRTDRFPALGVPAAAVSEPGQASLAPFCRPILTLGPCYKEADGSWVPLAGLARDWCDVAVRVQSTVAPVIAFQVEYHLGGGPTLWESFRLTENGLEYETRIEWVVGGFRLHLPLFVTDGEQVGVPTWRDQNLTLAIGGRCLRAEALDASWRWELEPGGAFANRWGTLQNALLQGRSALRFAVRLTVE